MVQVKVSGAQFKIACEIQKGYTNRQIAEELYISTRTVETHLWNLYISANVNSRLQLLVWLKSNSFVVVDPSIEIQHKIDLAHELQSKGNTTAQIAKRMQVHHSTAYKYLNYRDPSPTLPTLPTLPVEYTGFQVIACPPKTLCYFWGA